MKRRKKVAHNIDRNESKAAKSDLYHFIMQTPSPTAILIGPEHRFLMTNPSYDRLAGRKCMGKTVREAFTESEAGDFIPLLDDVYRTGIPFSGKELAATFPDENGIVRERFLNVTYHPFRNERGEIIGILTDQQEVTEYVQARKALEESKAALEAEQEMLETIFQNAPAAMALWKGPDLVFEKVNPEFENAFSCRPVIGKPLLEACPELRGQGFDDLLLNVLKTGKPFMANDMPAQIAKNKEEPAESKYFDLSCVRILDHEDKPYGVYIHAVDVTGRVHAQQRLRESEELLRLAIRGGNMGAWTILLPEGELILDRNARDITGFFEEADHFEVAINHRVHPDDRDRIRDAFRKSIENNTVLKVECRSQVTKGGSWHWFAIRGEPRLDEKGQTISLSGVLFDITDQKFMQHELELAKIDAERANQAKSAFLANMSHEIRTPLSSILGFSKLLKDEPPDSPERDQYVAAIDRNGLALTRLIEDILDLAKIESGRVEMEWIEFSLYDLVRDAVELFRENARKKNISLNLSIDETVSERVCSDPNRLRQILLNLIGNAVKFTEKGGVQVHVRTLPSSIKNKVKIRIDVEDSGIGLTEEQKRKLFQPFVQADSSTTRNFGGTGLGLALSQRLAEALGGKITIGKCSQQAGCTFILEFSATLPKAGQPTRSEERQKDQKKDRPEISPLEADHGNGSPYDVRRTV
jgi:PAS domain S-box-containing protein